MIGAQDMTSPLRRVILRRPNEVTAQADPAEWHYQSAVDVKRAGEQHDALAKIIQHFGAEAIALEAPADRKSADSIFTHDISLVTHRGAIILRPGKLLRRCESSAHEQTYERNGIAILGRIEAPGTAEGGDCLWVDENTLAVGCGFRTNTDGIAQLTRMLEPLGVAVHAFDMPVWSGVDACLHLMSLVSQLDRDLAIVNQSLLPVRLFKLFEERGVRMVQAPPAEFERSGGMSLNVLALAPRHCVMIAGYPETERVLREAGCEIKTFAGDELCVKMEGGPTCLTRPVLRGG